MKSGNLGREQAKTPYTGQDIRFTTKDDALYDDTRRAVKSVQKAADGISEVTPVTVLRIVLGTVIR